MSLKSIVPSVFVLVMATGGLMAQDEAPAADAGIVELESRVEQAKAATSEAQAQLDSAKAELAVQETALKEALPPVSLSLTRGWSWDAQMGINGSTGNTEQVNYRAAVNGSRETDRLSTKVKATYAYANNEGVKTDNRLVIEGRNDWKLKDSLWRVFANGKYEYDEFQDWDQRYSGFFGLGYEITDNDKHTLISRAGLGGNQTIGGSDETLTPEGFLGLDYTWRVKQGQRFKAGTEFLPSFDDLNQFRVNSYAEYQLVLSQESNMILTTGVEHRFDSNPGTAKHNELDYYMTLGWKF